MNIAEKGQQEFLVPKNLTEAKELVNKLSIDDLRTFCSMFALGQDRSKASLKKMTSRILQRTVYTGKRNS